MPMNSSGFDSDVISDYEYVEVDENVINNLTSGKMITALKQDAEFNPVKIIRDTCKVLLEASYSLAEHSTPDRQEMFVSAMMVYLGADAVNDNSSSLAEYLETKGLDSINTLLFETGAFSKSTSKS